MKEFDIEKAKAGAPVCTRDGHKARIICYDRGTGVGTTEYPIVALIENGYDSEDMRSYTIDGHQWHEGTPDNDLMIASVHHQGWVNIFYNNKYNIYSFGSICKSKNDAVASSQTIMGENDEFAATIKIEWDDNNI